jgi:hypothetical protein
VVEGFYAAPDQRIGDFISIMKHVLCGDAKYVDAPALEPFSADIVALRPVDEIMGSAIDFDRKFGRRAIEVEDLRPDRVLPAKTNVRAA